ncbi:gamma-glutamyl-gamma-aminobutyrate hydrolase family protein [Actinomycetaceae bacterium L2_0104]
MNKPFLILVARPDSPIKADEVAAICRYGELQEQDLEILDLQYPLERMPDFSQYSGVIITGSPYNYLTPIEQKSPTQLQIEANILPLCEEILAGDIPTLGLCYGLQVLAVAAGGTLTREYAENMSATEIHLTEEGKADPLTSQLPPVFLSYVAHAEAVDRIPDSMVVLAHSAGSPVHLARFKTNIYGTQHHPEIDREGIALRVALYVGVYFSEEEHPEVLRAVQSVQTDQSLITHFVRKYGN